MWILSASQGIYRDVFGNVGVQEENYYGQTVVVVVRVQAEKPSESKLDSQSLSLQLLLFCSTWSRTLHRWRQICANIANS